MQIKKEILLFLSLVLLCITLITAANYTKETVESCKMPGAPADNCCKIYQKQNSNTSPWNFITQGILHLIA